MKKAEYQAILNQVKENFNGESMQAIRNHVATFENEVKKVRAIDKEYNEKINEVYERIDKERNAFREAKLEEQKKHIEKLKELNKEANSIYYGLPLNMSIYEMFFNDLKCKCNSNSIRVLFSNTPVLEVKEDRPYISRDIATAFIKYDESVKGENWLKANNIRFWYSEFNEYFYFEMFNHNVKYGNESYRGWLSKDYKLNTIEEYEKNYFLLKEQEKKIKNEIERMTNLVNDLEAKNMVNFDSYYRLKNY